jgi:DNA-binding beta-propeller fold protein YncE
MTTVRNVMATGLYGHAVPAVGGGSLPTFGVTYNRQIGQHASYAPAPFGNGQFVAPMGVSVYGNEVYVVDYANRLGNKLHVFNLAGDVQRAWAPWGVMGAGNLQYCGGVFVYGDEVYVIDEAFSKITVYTIGSGATPGTFTREFGVSGTGDGEWILAYKLCIFNNEIYVADGQNNRIMVVGLTGTYIRKWGSTGSTDGKFAELSPYSCCVYNNEIYTTDLGNYRVQVFNLNGTFKRKWGSMGTGDGQFGQYAVLTIAVAQGEVFVADTINNRITVFDVNGTFLRKFGAAGTELNQFGASNAPVDICIYNNEVFLVDTGAVANHRIQVWD